MISNSRLKEEITAVKTALSNLRETIKKCEDGIWLNELVLKTFEDAL